MLSPRLALFWESRDTYPSVMPLAQLLPQIANLTCASEMQAMDDEWRRSPLCNLPADIAQEIGRDKFWSKLTVHTNVSDDTEFPLLPIFALQVLTLPH